QSFVRGVFTFFLMLMVSAYLLVTSDQIVRFFRNLWEVDRRRSFDRLVRRIDRGLGGVVRGQLLIALVNGVLSGIGFWMFDLRYWPVLTLFTTVLSVIPIFGTLISSVPAVLLGLEISFGTGLLVLGWIVLIHQIEGNLLNPKIMGDSAKMHPALIIFALLAGESAFGIAGTLLAVPVLSVLQSLFLHYREQAIGIRSPTPTDPGVYEAPRT
ncbi:MAG: AI-2E family transporter, partial [Myxococcota bacterium]